MTYLGTELDPINYYSVHSDNYLNRHADAVKQIVDRYAKYMHTGTLDIGCGDGIISKLLWENHGIRCVGIDSEPKMVARYCRETKNEGCIAYFWDQLPESRSAIASYSLHLCPSSRTYQVWWRIREAKIRTFLVISPFRDSLNEPRYGYILRDSCSVTTRRGKHVYGKLYEVGKGEVTNVQLAPTI